MSNSNNTVIELEIEQMREELDRGLEEYYSLLNSTSRQIDREDCIKSLKALFNHIKNKEREA